MKTQTTTMREPRTPISGVLYCRLQGDKLTAHWVNISRVGACILLDRAVTPGTLLELCFDSPQEPGAQVGLPAQAVWCAPAETPVTPGWRVGLRVDRRDPEAALAFAMIGQHARRNAAAVANGQRPYWRALRAGRSSDPTAQGQKAINKHHKDSTGTIVTS